MDGEWEAYEFAKHYQDLGYFGHALEILLHNVLEDEAESGIGFEEGNQFFSNIRVHAASIVRQGC